MAAAATDAQILEQTRKFNAMLSELAKVYLGKWVVFSNGTVHSAHDSADQAYAWALGRFNKGEPYIVAPVVASAEPTPVTAGVMFGIR